MKRRAFIRDTATFLTGIGLSQSLAWGQYDPKVHAPTSTDILGPFYRPGAPIRVNINPTGYAGDIVNLSGTIYKDDGRTRFHGCLVEIWQCDSKQTYDNVSGEFRYRGAQKTSAEGRYHFVTARPVAYPAAPNSKILRPAHIHLRISAEKQQDLVTQIYIKGDPNIEKDPCASSPESANRILDFTRSTRNEESIGFDIVMAKEFKPDDNVFKKLSGLYAMNDNSMIEFYRGGDFLFMKWNGQIREALWYKGNNEFKGGFENSASFELLPNGEIKVRVHFVTVLRKESKLEGIKAFKY